jgi:HMG (high mobility group) box
MLSYIPCVQQTTNVAKMVSEAWKGMYKEEREIWEEKARKDRARYEVEAASYRGPWKVVAKRAKKPQDAPKRPMSAFLSFSNKRRMHVMRSNPNLTQGEISALLSKMWNEAPAEVRDTHMNQELEAREIYKRDIAAWREKDKEEKSKKRSARETKAAEMADSTNSGTIGPHTEPLTLVDMLSCIPSEDFAAYSRATVHDQNFARYASSSNTACFEQQQVAFQQQSDVNQVQQETLDSLIRANMAAVMGFQQQTMTWQHLFSNSIGFQPLAHQQIGLQTQMSLSMDHNVRASLQLQRGITNFPEDNDLLNSQGKDEDKGMMDWVDFALGE